MGYTVDYAVSPRQSDAIPYGIVIDGVVYQLDGQPPIAVSKGWGDMKWLYN